MPDVVETLNKLPLLCYLQMPSNPNFVIKVRRGVMGFFPVEHHETPEAAKEHCDMLNTFYKVTAQQKIAMEVGSHFGWEVPGADPDVYDEDGHVNSEKLNAIKNKPL